MRIIKKLDIFILKNYLTLFAGTFCISLFVVMMQFLWKYVDDLIGKGLELSVMAKFFFYAGETLVPLALPLAILLASLISFGNLGERLELLAIKAAGISLFRTLRPLIIFNLFVAYGSFYFQDVIAPQANQNLMQLLYSMRQKSPELDIPEGVFYDGIDGLNLYVRQKDKETGALYNIIIYNMRDGVDNAHIILADSGRLETSADKQHLLLHLYHGEQFENLRSGALVTNNVPYRRETFVVKHFIIDFDTNFNMADGDSFTSSATTKNMRQLVADIDSLETYYDSLGITYYNEMKRSALFIPSGSRDDSGVGNEGTRQKPSAAEQHAKVVLDSVFAHLASGEQEAAVRSAMQKVSIQQMDTEFKSASMEDGNSQIRRHWLKFWEKITMSLACIVFFFIGAPLGAIIRKGGLGLPVVVSVVIFIIYYIINTAGMKLGRQGSIPVWFGMWLSTIVLAPLGLFFTVKSNNDSVVFNMDAYTAFFRKLWGVRIKRHISRKEVIINTPDYGWCAEELGAIADSCKAYQREHRLHLLPNYLDLYFRNERDEDIEALREKIEAVVEDLSNSRDKKILYDLNDMPVLDAYSHTAPFRNRKWNMAAGILFPVGIGLMFRIVRFRRRLKTDLRTIIKTGTSLKARCETLVG
ncbi:MAG: LptF/LptG family permease [Bacteroides sp.]|nr:LptF/LptG family permease [Roseburia sp.]MCM1347345.1 LptF/LptG family permease [Bacteroides sp.]MCM1421843.1 LptF/LptG family permease [Bacteroides sp.]